MSRLPHKDVVNAVAFNPRDPEMLVTVSDDNKIKVGVGKGYTHERFFPFLFLCLKTENYVFMITLEFLGMCLLLSLLLAVVIMVMFSE